MQLHDIYPVAAILLILGAIGYFLWTMLPDLLAMLFGLVSQRHPYFKKATHKAGFTTNEGAMGSASTSMPSKDTLKIFKLFLGILFVMVMGALSNYVF